MKRALSLSLLFASSLPAQDALFIFRSGLWLNLHHFLYVLGRARNGAGDSRREAVREAPEDVEGMDRLSESERKVWDDSIAYYQKSLSARDAVFDKELVAVTEKLAAGNLDALAGELKTTLKQAEPIYRKVWWTRHDRGNQERIADLKNLLEAHGRPIAAGIKKAWAEKWPPAGRTVNVCAYATWAGAYSTGDGLIVVGSRDPSTGGTAGLETLFHEAMHQWDENFDHRIQQAAAAVHAQVPRSFSHSLIFFTAGYVVAREIPGYTPYADAKGMWNGRGLFSRQRIEQEWVPYLKGQRGMPEALERLLAN